MSHDDSEPVTPATPKAIEMMRAAATKLRNGTYTISHPQKGHFTVKLHTVKEGPLGGKRIFSMLVGPNNETDYSGCAFWNETEACAYVWRRFQGHHNDPAQATCAAGASNAEINNRFISGWTWNATGWSQTEQKLSILLCLALRGANSYWRAEGYALQVEGRCYVCNRKLTTPESIEFGIGPICAARV